MKVKSRETTEVVVGAVTGSLQRPESVIAGLMTQAGQLSIVGRTTRVESTAGRRPGHSPQTDRPAAAPLACTDRRPAQIGGQFGGSPVRVVHVSPDLVAEVSADRALQAGRWRHPLRLLRLRPDHPRACLATVVPERSRPHGPRTISLDPQRRSHHQPARRAHPAACQSGCTGRT